MNDCLERFQVAGLQTNIEFLKRALNHEAFIKGGVTTDFIPKYKDELFKTDIDTRGLDKAKAFASLAYLLYSNQNILNNGLIGYTTNGNINGSNGMERIILYDIKDDTQSFGDIYIGRGEHDKYIIINNETKEEFIVNNAILSKDESKLILKLDNEYIDCDISFYDNKLTLFHAGTRYDFIHTPNINLQYPPEFMKGKGGIVIAETPDEDSPIVAHKSPMQAQVANLMLKKVMLYLKMM